MAMDLATIYRKTFSDNQRAIAGSLHLEPDANTNFTQLHDAQVIIDGNLISKLVNTDINKRGELVVENIIARNNLDVYEKFLAVWPCICQSAAEEFETKLNFVLTNWRKRRHQLTTASPVAPPVAASLNPVHHQPPPANPGLPPAVASLVLDLINVYKLTFLAHQRALARSLHLQPEVNTNLAQLLDAKVIVDGSLISKLINTEVNHRGALVVEYIIARNKLDVYEKFLAVWLLINQTAANEFLANLNYVLRGLDMRRHQLTMAQPAPSPIAANLNSVHHQPPPANPVLPPAVDSLDPADYKPLQSDPTGFKWLRAWQDAMNNKRIALKCGFQFDSIMFDILRQKNVITHEQHVSITAEHQPYNKAGIMYGALEQRGPNTIRLFIAILRNIANLLADEVQDTYNSAMLEARN